MSTPSTGDSSNAVIETPHEAVYDVNAAQFANDNEAYALIIGNNVYESSEYKSLNGAIADANAIEGILKDLVKLKSDDEHTINLRNANRQQMLDGFEKLKKITEKTEDPCIIIFYAGHGAQAERPTGWADDAAEREKVEMLCPVDLGMPTVGKDGRAGVVEGIPDRLVAAFLTSANRDDDGPDDGKVERWISNPPPITAEANVIPDPPSDDPLDGEGKRGIRVATGFGEKYASSHVLLAACGRDKKAFENKKTGHGVFTEGIIRVLRNIQKTGEGAKAKGNGETKGGGDSETKGGNKGGGDGENKGGGDGENKGGGDGKDNHKGKDEDEDEDEGNKKKTQPDTKSIQVEKETYLTLMQRMDWMPTWQTPHCMGVNVDRPLFNRRGSRSDPSFIPCKVVKVRKTAGMKNQPVTCMLLAGLAEGVRCGEVFGLYKAIPFEGQNDAGDSFGEMFAAHVDATSALLQRFDGNDEPKKVPKVFYAKRKFGPDYPVSILCEDETLRLQVESLFPEEDPPTRKPMVNIVKDANAAPALILRAKGDAVSFERGDSSLKESPPTGLPLEDLLPAGRHFPRSVNRNVPGQIRGVIDGWRHFNYHLRRENEHRYDFRHVRMEMHYLEPADGDWHGYHPRYVPIGENLLTGEEARVSVSDEQTKRPLGLTLHNEGDVDVYPYLFYFDPTELTITPWPLVAEGAGSGRVDSPLPKKSKLTVGYGDGGADPLKFYFEGDTTKDIGYFRLFIAHRPSYFRSLGQEGSPFPQGHRDGEDEDMMQVETSKVDADRQLTQNKEEEERLAKVVWGVKTYTIIQEKAVKSLEKAESSQATM